MEFEVFILRKIVVKNSLKHKYLTTEFKGYNKSPLNFIVSKEEKEEGQRGRGQRKI